MIPWSLSTTMYQRYFTTPAGVQKLVAMIEANIDTQLKVELNTLARGVLRKLVLSAYQVKAHTLQCVHSFFTECSSLY